MTTPEPLPEWQRQAAEPPVAGMPYLAQPPYQQYPPPQQYPYHPYPPARPTNGMAIASMVLGIVWVYWIGSILALIFGYVALKEIRRSGQSGEGMAIAGIVLGWIGVGIFLITVLVVATRGFS
ncbi:DUF4190 domain-containing protein [Actinophytocola sp. KF-1]